MIPGSASPFFLGSSLAAGAGGLQVEKSLRFNSLDSAYLSRTPAAGNRKKWTFSCWLKKTNTTATQGIFSASGVGYFELFIDNTRQAITVDDGSDYFYAYSTGTEGTLRDPAAWYHIVLTLDAANVTQADKLRLWVNNRLITRTAYAVIDQEYAINAVGQHEIGQWRSGSYLNGYLANVHFIDGQALDYTSFTAVSATTGQLIPKAYTGTYTGNSFWLQFNDNSAATAATLGKDSFLLGNNWTPNNFSVTAGSNNDSLVDTPTSYGTDTGVGGEVRGNYCTWNPIGNNFWNNSASFTLSDGNLRVNNGTSFGAASGSIAVSSGKFYWEISFVGTVDPDWDSLGIVAIDATGAIPGTFDGLYGYLGGGKKISNANGYIGSAYGAAYTSANVVGVAFDADNGTITFYKDGVSQSTAFTGIASSRGWTPYVGDYANAVTTTAWIGNFGQRAFAYTAPSGFKALCDTNLGAPVVAKPSTVFDVITYTGTGSSLTLPNGSSTPTSISFTPDFAWLKGRSGATDHALYDAVRGVQKDLVSNSTSAETTETTGLTAFGTNTFTVGSLAKLNTSSSTYVAWAWNAGGSTASNGSGSITSQVRANVSAGFSVVTYTGTGSNATVGHSLGVAAGLVIVKRRDTAANWQVRHTAIAAASSIQLNLTNAAASATTVWNSTAPSSTVFSIGTDATINASAGTYVAYCFASVAGYSNAFSYTGNGAADGSFVYLGFRPRLIMLKRSDSTSNWTLLDTSRKGYNVDNDPLYPNLSDAEGTTDLLDITSNGFKLRSTDASVNASAGTYIGFAWAENPFQYARAR